MKWGLIARAETGRGLGIQTYEMYRHLHPDRTMIVTTKDTFPTDTSRFGKATVVKFHNEQLHEPTVRHWMNGLDAIVTVETLYDWRIADWARAAGVRTIVHGNPEFHKHALIQLPEPDVWWWPTTWRLDLLPPGPVVPVPVPDDVPFSAADDAATGVIKFLFIGGKPALGDRNGAQTLLQALPRARQRFEVTIRSQTGRLGQGQIRSNRNVRVTELHAVRDRWSMYKGQHALVLPRRYGGLCLPALEAMASGLALVMPDCSPNTDWPIFPVHSAPGRRLHMQSGRVETFDTLPNDLVTKLDALVINRRLLIEQQAASREWAEQNRWSTLAPLYHHEIETACNS